MRKNFCRASPSEEQEYVEWSRRENTGSSRKKDTNRKPWFKREIANFRSFACDTYIIIEWPLDSGSAKAFSSSHKDSFHLLEAALDAAQALKYVAGNYLNI